MNGLRLLIVTIFLIKSICVQVSNPFIGNWAIKMPDGQAGWLSIKSEDGILRGELWTVGAPKKLTELVYENSTIRFYHRRAVGDKEYVGGPPNGPKIPCLHIASLEGDNINIVMDRPTSNESVEKIHFTGNRIAPLPSKPDMSNIKYGKPIYLFNGKNLDGWKLTNPGQINAWKAINGELVNNTPKKTFDPYAHYGNLRTVQEFDDFNLKIEFKVPKGGNSGIYLKGRYEAQVVDKDSRMQGINGIGAIFNRIPPNRNYGKLGGEWQTYDITLIDRHVTVILNGHLVIDNMPLEGCTNGALNADDSLPGPIYLQGDHTFVTYRNIVLTPIIKD
ncbi:3-keto-disaccharide hydrolase [Seonamhaeicola maritimus]|uniref:3-keto-disaccharide hydrolase n=1 Tax=Seonamhaeicola maritimus TaxID=2591822 RepID=UPI0024942A38|nr:DUF1080 domain-containing protein [Seonamhaeicola maritimus]